ncbi:MAG: hypothetical protein ACYC26_04730 [Phycisphaerales bacterium]
MKTIAGLIGLVMLAHAHAAPADIQGFEVRFNPRGGFEVRQAGAIISHNSMFLCMEPPWNTHWFYADKHHPIITTLSDGVEVKTDPDHPSPFNLESYKLTILSPTTWRISVRGKLTQDVPAFIEHVPISIPEALMAGAKITFGDKTVDLADFADQPMPPSAPFADCIIRGKTHDLRIHIIKGSHYVMHDRRDKPYLGQKTFILLPPKRLDIQKDQLFEQEIEFTVTSRPANTSTSAQPQPVPAVLKTSGFFGAADHALSLADIVRQGPPDSARFTWADYDKLLAEITKPRYRVLPLKDFDTDTTTDKVLVGLRHDIDSHPEKALVMADLETKAGMRSTYFFLHSASYYGSVKNGLMIRNAAIDDLAKQLHDRGFEIGIHTDLFTLMWDHQFKPASFIKEEIAYYKNLGIPVTGAAAHGSASVIDRGVNNMWMFSEFNKKGEIVVNGKTYEYGNHSIADHGLAYEGYHLRRDAYTGDIDPRFQDKPVEDMIAYIASLPPGARLIILAHPEHWGARQAH